MFIQVIERSLQNLAPCSSLLIFRKNYLNNLLGKISKLTKEHKKGGGEIFITITFQLQYHS